VKDVESPKKSMFDRRFQVDSQLQTSEALGKKTKERVDSFLPSTVYLKVLASSSMPGMPSCKVNSRAYLGLIVGIIKVSKMDDAPRGTETAAAEGGGEARGWEERVEREVECD